MSKKIFTTLLLVFSLSLCKAQWVTIPDANFVAWLNANGYASCMSGNQMDTTCNSIVTATTLSVGAGLYTDLTGVQYFDSLQTLALWQNFITWLPQLPAGLKQLWCHSNNLSSLPILPNGLTKLICWQNQLTTLPNLPSSLIQLQCNNNLLTTLPPLPNNLSLLTCQGNLLTALPALPESLTELLCGSNQLTAIPELPDSLYWLQCDLNNNLWCLPYLPNTLQHLSFNSTSVSCIPNFINIPSCSPLLSSLPICGINNGNNCSVNWNIFGKTFFDANNNCIYDSGDTTLQNIKVELLSGGNLLQQTFTTLGGTFLFDVDTFGTYEVEVDTSMLPFLVSCPSGGIHYSIISIIDSLDENADFGFVCKPDFNVAVNSVVVDSGTISHNRKCLVKIFAGDLANYYGAVHCLNGIGGQLQVVINGPANYIGYKIGSLPPSSVIGNILTWNISDFSTVDFNNDFNIRLFTNGATPGQVCFEVSISSSPIDENSSDDTLIHCFPIVASFDPNEKEVSPLIYFDPNEWLTYTIHFQNIGTTDAQDIQILDTIDSNLDASTFQLLTYSYAPITQLFGNDVSFNFPNINLPDSITDFEGSKGFVSYRIKPLANLPAGTTIENTAGIYFDFNSPVVTNTVSNLMCNPITPTNISEIICSNEFYNFHGNNLNISGNYSVTLNAVNSCDSVVNLNLSVLSAQINSQIASICAGDTFGFFGLQLTSSGNYSMTYSAVNGCDSIFNLQLSVFIPDTILLIQSICNGEVFDFNGQQLSSSGNYSATLNAANGCDSIVNLNLTVLNPSSSSLNQNICLGDVFNFNGVNLSSSGIYFDTLTSVSTCDSVITLNLTVENINANIQQSNDTLTAMGNGTVQWYDCNTQQIITGATQNVFVPTVSGNYAVIITSNNCVDTSACIQIYTGVNELQFADYTFQIYPNPSDDEITISLSQPCENCRIEITNTLGQVLFTKSMNQQSVICNLQSLPSGIYFVTLRSDNFSAVKKLVRE